MATLGDPVKLTNVADSSHITGITCHKPNNDVLFTTSNGRSYLYDLPDQKLTHSWSVRHASQITCPAVQIDVNQFAAVVNQDTLRIWTKEDTYIDKRKKNVVGKKLHRLVPVGSLGIVILGEDGSISTMENPSDSLSEGMLKRDDHVIWHTAAALSADRGFLAAVVNNKDGNCQVLVHWLTFGEDSKVATHHTLCEIDITGTLLCSDAWPVAPNAIDLYLLESDGMLKKIHLTEDEDVLQVKSMHKFTAVTKETKFVCAGTDHIVVTGATDDNLTEDSVGLLDLNFKAVQESRTLPKECARCSKMFRLENHIVMCCTKGMVAIPYTTGPSRLSALLGKFTHSTDSSSIQEVSWKGSQKDSVNSSHNEALARLSDPAKVKTYKNFQEEYKKFSDIYKGGRIGLCNLDPLIRRCSKEKSFWPSAELKDLLKHRALQASHAEMLLPQLLQHHDLTLTCLCLTLVDNLTEAFMISSLNLFLRTDEEKFKDIEEVSVKSAEENCPLGPKKAACINLVLSLSFNEAFLVNHLRELGFEEVMNLLKYLSFLLSSNPQQKSGSPSASQAVDWMNMLLDAHFTQLLLTDDARELLLELHQLVESQVQFYDELISLENILSRLSQTFIKKQKVGLYCIETLHL